jgi:integrase
MSIEYRGEGKFRFRVRKDGINYTQNFFTDKAITEKDLEEKKYPKEVNDAHKKFEVDVISGNMGMDESMKFEKLAQLVLDEYMKPNTRASSQETYISISNNHLLPYFGGMNLNKIKPIHIQKLINEKALDYAPVTVSSMYNILNKTLNKAVQWEIISSNPCKNISLPKRKNKNYQELLSSEDIKKLIKAINSQPIRDKTIFSIALYTGMRQGEILGLHIPDIDFDEMTINVSKQYGKVVKDEKVVRAITDTKTDNSIRKIYIPEFLNSLIKEYVNSLKVISKDGILFYNVPRKKPYERTQITDNFKAMLKDNNIPEIRFHDLRHLYATMAINSGVNVVAVARTLGDTIETVLKNYTHGIEEEQKKATYTFEEYINNL